jgi:transcriptional regulator with XRE-family HTH domain
MASTFRAQVGTRIRNLRRKRGWRQIDLAAHAELSKTHICEIEVGKREIGLEALKRIADALEKSLSELLEGI